VGAGIGDTQGAELRNKRGDKGGKGRPAALGAMGSDIAQGASSHSIKCVQERGV